MTRSNSGAQLSALGRLLLGKDTSQLIGYVLQAAKGIHEHVSRWREQGIYEVLTHDTTLELKDSRGEVAVVKRREVVRFLQNHVPAITDHAWGDGEIFAAYCCRPGKPVDFFQDGSRDTVLISLREIKNRGDQLTFEIRRKIVGGFHEASQSWETDIYHRTKAMSLRVVFPISRRCQRATVTQRSTSRTVVLGDEHFRFLQDGSQRLTWEVRRPRLHDRYSLKWEW